MTWSEFAVNWWTWWQGDLTGIIIVTPLLLSWTLHEARFTSRAQAAEFFALMVSSSLVVAAIFGDWFVEDRPLPLSFLVLPFVVWSAFRFGQREVTTVGATVSVIAIWYTLAGGGEFARPAMNESLLCLLAFIGTVAVTGLVLSAALGRRAN